jgi:hypothetical protein
MREPLLSVVLVGVSLVGSTAHAAPSKAQCIEASEKAQDLRQAGTLRQARQQLTICVASSCPGPVREDCARLLADVESAQPSVVFVAKDRAGEDLVDVRVTLDGEVVADKLDGTAVSVDPGEHRFVFEADGLPTVEKRVIVREGDKNRHVSARMDRGGAAQSSSTANVEQPSEAKAIGQKPPSAATAATQSSGATQRTVGLVLGVAGVGALVIGGIFGVLTKTTYDNALQNECHNNPNTCTSQGAQEGRTAHTQGTISTVGFVAGGALLAGGAVLYFTAPNGRVGVGPAVDGRLGLRMVARW